MIYYYLIGMQSKLVTIKVEDNTYLECMYQQFKIDKHMIIYNYNSNITSNQTRK